MNKKEVARILEEIGIILDLQGENPFKVRAYYNGARIVETLDKDLTDLVKSGEIGEIKGIGKALAEKISTLINDGSLPFYEDLKSSIPEGLLQMLKIPGLGAKKVKVIYDKLGISSIGELEYACRENRLRDLQGFGQKSQDKIIESIELQRKYSERFLIPVAKNQGQQIFDYLKKNRNIIRIDIAGSLRRKMETVKDLDIIASCAEGDREEIMHYFVSLDQNINTISQGVTKSAVVLNSGITAELRLVTDSEYPFLLQHATGSKEHNTQLRRLAKEMNYKMNEYGLFLEDKPIVCEDEKAIYIKLGLQMIPPEAREGMGEIELAQNGDLPEVYDGKPFYGLFHVHTTYSDGANSLKEMADTCQTMGLDYVGICDHSKSAFYANGLSIERVKVQQEEIDQLNTKFDRFKIFKGIEADILQNGTMDYKDDILASFDFVVASVHSIFNLSEEAMTERICRALRNPYVTMLGHPTGRLLLAREAYKLNMEKVIDVAGEEKKIIEINANPFRLDLDWRWGKLARSKGVKTSINPDAHSIEGLKDYHYGIDIAKKGGFRKGEILNSFTVSEVEEYFHKK
jgi:DNA polymerase (family 10)